MNIAFIGIGRVGAALAEHLSRRGHQVVIAVHDPESESVRQARARMPELRSRPLAEAVKEAEVVFLATPFTAVEPALGAAGDLAGKVLVDCTNPIGADVSHALRGETSGGERVQRLAPKARVVKAFNTYGYENFENSNYPGYGSVLPAMLIAGNDGRAKEVVSDLCRQLGWEPIDAGDISLSLHLEHLTLLWVKMARVQGRGPDFVWAMLTR